ncbi:MAG: CBS domain-containing protein [Acidimicrobiia bacterium]|nr:CBS domain-containing protein [Acidimicrobiia bacterium]
MPSTTPVRDVMTSKVVTLRPDQTFEEAADTLADRKIGAAPVIDADGKLVGLRRDEDLIASQTNLHVPTWLNVFGVDFPIPGQQKHFEEELKQMVAATVQDLMTTEFPTTGPDDPLADVATKMHDDDITHMPVVDADGTLVGIVARGDIVRRVADIT